MAISLLVAGFLASAASGAALTDDGLVARATAIIHATDEKGLPEDGLLGFYKGVKVLVESHCSDICPFYTVHIVHYDLKPESPECTASGGHVVTVLVPVAIAVSPTQFCVPEVLYRKKAFAGHPFEEPHS